jgi:hypothetical protein
MVSIFCCGSYMYISLEFLTFAFFYYTVNELGVVAIFLTNMFNCTDFSIIIGLVQRYDEESVDHGMLHVSIGGVT